MKINTEIRVYFERSLEDFFKIEQISFAERIKVAVRLVDKNTRVKFAVKCAEYVLPILEEKFSDYEGVRNCIEFLKSIDNCYYLNKDQLELLQFYKNYTFYDKYFSFHYSNDNDSNNVFYDSAYFAAYFAFYSAYSSADFNSSIKTTHKFAFNSAYYAAHAVSKSNNNDLNIHSTIFQFLLDLTN